jgi:hypothetical protein
LRSRWIVVRQDLFVAVLRAVIGEGDLGIL